MYLPGVACILLLLVCGGMGLKIYFMRKAADEIRRQCALRLEEDSNVGIDISSRDGKMLALAADLDGQMKKLRRTRLKYEEGDAELKRAVTNISHDLRTPLTALSGYMQLLEKEEVPPRVREYLDIMDDRILAMTRLTEELFHYSVIVSPDKRPSAYRDQNMAKKNRDAMIAEADSRGINKNLSNYAMDSFSMHSKREESWNHRSIHRYI